MNCSKCGVAISPGEDYTRYGRIFCEDCYLFTIEPPRTCDVSAVNAAKHHRAMAGETGTQGMREIHKKIHHYLTTHGQATKEDICREFGLSTMEMEREIATMRHCELIKGKRENGIIYIVPFDA